MPTRVKVVSVRFGRPAAGGGAISRSSSAVAVPVATAAKKEGNGGAIVPAKAQADKAQAVAAGTDVSAPCPPQRTQNRARAELSEVASQNTSEQKKNGKKSKTNAHHHSKHWAGRFQELKQYKAKYGNSNVPIGYGANPQLGKWVNNQRYQYRLLKEGSKSHMTEERIDMLERLKFEWTAANKHEKAWEKRFVELKRYNAEHGHCNVKQRDSQLGSWVAKQRHLYRLLIEGEMSSMTKERIDRLESMGFKWSNLCWLPQENE